MENIIPKCAFCGQVPIEGFYSGLRLNKKMICSICEKDIISVEAGTARYQKHLSFIRKILYEKAAVKYPIKYDKILY